MLPHNFGMKKPTNIDHVLRVKEKIKMLESLYDIVITEQAFVRAMEDLKQKDASNVLQNELYANINELSRDQDAPCAAMVDTILGSIEGTHADAHRNLKVTVRHIFEIEKPTEKLRYQPFEKRMHNKFLLWHGCK